MEPRMFALFGQLSTTCRNCPNLYRWFPAFTGQSVASTTLRQGVTSGFGRFGSRRTRVSPGGRILPTRLSPNRSWLGI